ncbi:MAG: M1 family peptidase [Bacteroidetes bacterium]|nr:M1 family peptidase [Bacteroidota bacterium]
MRNLKNILIATSLLLFPKIVLADDYPVNKNIDIKHYAFHLTLSDDTDEILGNAKVSILFKKAGIQSFRLDLINKTTDRQCKGMQIDSIKAGNIPVLFSHQNDEIIINLPSPSVANTELEFSIKYHGIPFDGLKIGPTRNGDRSFFCENWPNKARHWLPTYDHPSDKATSEFIVVAPSHYKVVSNGLLMEESDLGNNTKLTHWKQSVPVSCWLTVLGVADFAVKYVDRFEGKTVETWVYSKDREAGFYDFDEPTKKVLELFSSYVGPFAYEKLANIQSVNSGGGMETSSAIFYSDKLINGKRDVRLRNVVIHELAHQWFGNCVTESTWDDAWLSEGFATFFTMLFIEKEYGKEEFDKEVIKSKESVFKMAKKMPDFSIVSPRTAEKEDVTSGLTYQKGAWILYMLRDMIGENNFKKGIQSYYAKFFNGSATTDDFRIEMEKASGKDLKTFFKQWLFQPINPFINGTWNFDEKSKKLTIQLSQIQDFTYSLPIEIAYYTKGNSKPTILKMNLTKKQQIQTFNLNAIPEKVEFDPRNVLLSENVFVKK